PGYDYDLSHSGKGPSHGWAFFTSYNTEQAHSLKERGASQNDKDFVAAVNWKLAEQCVAEGKGRKEAAVYAHNVLDEATHVASHELRREVTVLEPSGCPGLVYFLPTP